MLKQTYELFDNDEYTISMEYSDVCVFIHCEVYRFNKTILKEIKEDFNCICDTLTSSGVEELFAYTRNVKFSNMISPCKTIKDLGNDFILVMWDLRKQ